MRVCIELPRDYGWGPVRILRGRMEDDGYQVTEIRSPSHILLAVTGGGRPGRATELEGVAAGVPQRAPYGVLPALPALAPLLPGGGLAQGSVVAVESAGALCLALIAGPSQAGMWCGVAGMPHLGIVAAAEAGAEPGRMMLVPELGQRWPEEAAVMLDACQIVLLRPPERVSAAVRRRLETVARRSGSVLAVAGPWEGAPVRLRVARQAWEGVGDGYGRLRARRAEVIAEGRGCWYGHAGDGCGCPARTGMSRPPMSRRGTAAGMSGTSRIADEAVPVQNGGSRIRPDRLQATVGLLPACAAVDLDAFTTLRAANFSDGAKSSASTSYAERWAVGTNGRQRWPPRRYRCWAAKPISGRVNRANT